MSKKKLLVLLAVAACAFGIGFGATAEAYPPVPPGMYGRAKWRGYFDNNLDTAGGFVFDCSTSGAYNYYNGQDNCNAFPSTINTAQEFIDFIENKLDHGSAKDRIGAAFIINTIVTSADNQSASRNKNPTPAERQAFRDKIFSIEPYIQWNITTYSYDLNSYNQGSGGNPNDIAFYDDQQSGHRTLVFRNSSGDILYAIKTRCANPVGRSASPPPGISAFNMDGTSMINGAAGPVVVAPGETVNFSHTLSNPSVPGGGSTSPATIGWRVQRGSTTDGSGTWTDVILGNAGIFTSGQTKTGIGVETNQLIPNDAAPGSYICRRIVWSPDTQGGGSAASTPACAQVQYNFTLMPSVNVSINGAPSTSGSFAEPGDTITFSYAVNNGGTSPSQNVNCTYRQDEHVGYSTVAPGTVFTPGGADCSQSVGKTFPAGNTLIAADDTVVVSTVNRSICRTLSVQPLSQTDGGSATSQVVCVHVAGKPYMRAYGGDVSVGGGFAVESGGGCTVDNTAAIIGWNKRGSGDWAGAGVQYAAYAIEQIYDFSSALGGASGSSTTAARPQGLSFANTGTDVNNGDFGGLFGSATCMTNYYVQRPAGAPGLPASITAMTSGVYGADSNTHFAGPTNTISPGEHITVYVHGNVYISTNIEYAGSGSWSSSTVPGFRLIVLGDIFIDQNVTRLDGLYVAQPDGSSGGRIYTCATAAQMYTPLALNTIGSQCTNGLTVNGSFVAQQVHLLRTRGSLHQSSAGEGSGSGSIAEVFNFTPALWMAQPDAGAGAAPYDAITSLPPVL